MVWLVATATVRKARCSRIGAEGLVHLDPCNRFGATGLMQQRNRFGATWSLQQVRYKRFSELWIDATGSVQEFRCNTFDATDSLQQIRRERVGAT